MLCVGVLPIALQVMLVTTLNVHPAVAAAVSTSVSGGKSAAKKGVSPPESSDFYTKMINNRAYGFVKRLVLGAGSRATYRKWRVGDTRNDVAMLINGVSTLIIVSAVFLLGTVAERRYSARQYDRMTKEVLREQQYRQVAASLCGQRRTS